MKYLIALFLVLCTNATPISAEQVVTSSFATISLAGGTNSAPQLGVAGNGNAIAVWQTFPNFIQTAWFNHTTQIWTFFGTLAQGNAPVIAVDGLGNAFILFVNLSNQIIAARFDAVNQSYSFTQLSSSGTINTSPRIAVNTSGSHGVAIWIQNTPFQILSSAFDTATLSWSVPTIFAGNVFPATFGIDNFNTGVALINAFPSAQIQAANMAIVP